LNRQLTCEVNIPSRQQCRIAHAERQASQKIAEVNDAFRYIEPKDYDDPLSEAISKIYLPDGEEKEL
jgi:hypothetical protein